MSFMQKQVLKSLYFAVETDCGTEVVPHYVIGRTCGTAAEAFADYVEGEILDPEEVVECREGWICRLSAPGYMDCTDWSAFDTEDECHEYLDEFYGEEIDD